MPGHGALKPFDLALGELAVLERAIALAGTGMLAARAISDCRPKLHTPNGFQEVSRAAQCICPHGGHAAEVAQAIIVERGA